MAAPPPIPHRLKDRFLMPFEKNTVITVSEGVIYSPEEQATHGEKEHNAIDIAAPFGTPVYAAMSGFAYGGYQFLRKQGVGMGGGFFVEIVDPKDGLRFQVCHLKAVAPGIDYHKPVKRSDEWWHPFQMDRNRHIIPAGKPIKAGDLIGWVGTSGLAKKGVVETPETAGGLASWDEFHAHIWAGKRSDETGGKIASYDVFWIYSGDLAAYNAALTNPRGEDMWARDKGGQLIFAR